MKRKVILGIIVVLGIMGVASTSIVIANEGITMKETQRPTKPVPIHYKETIGSLVYEIQLDQNEFGLDDEIEVSAKVTNVGKEAMTYVSGSSSCPNHAVVNIIHQESNTRLAVKPYGPCTADLGKSKLEPGQVVEDKLIFIAKYHSKSGLEPALPGTYDVQIALPPEDSRITEDYQSIPINPRPSIKTQIILSDNH